MGTLDEFGIGKTINPKTMRGPFCESADVPDTAYDDGKLANRAIRDLKG